MARKNTERRAAAKDDTREVDVLVLEALRFNLAPPYVFRSCGKAPRAAATLRPVAANRFNVKMRFVFNILLFLGLACFGMAVSTYLAGQLLVPKGSGLAGPVIAMGYGVIGALLAGVAGLLIGLRLSGRALKHLSLGVFGASLLLIALFIYRYIQGQEASKDPASEYLGIAPFTLTLEQIKIVDPYLSTKTELDARRRSWATTLPDGRVCHGIMRAKQQRRVAEALTALTEQSVAECRETEQAAERSLNWQLFDSKTAVASGQLMISPSCMASVPMIARLVNAALQANFSPTSPVKCE